MKSKQVSFGFAAPAFIVYTALLVLPIILALGISFTNWNGIMTTIPKFVGLDNYFAMIGDERLANAIKITFSIAAIVVVSVNVLGLGLAILLNNAGRMTNVGRSVFFAPYVLSTVAISFIWLSILSYTGVFNSLLEAVGLTDMVNDYIGNTKNAIISIAIIEIWRTLGFHMVIYLASLQTVPSELYEACIVDGGNKWHQFKSVTLPLIIPGITISVMMSVINELRLYDIVKVITDGGPGYSTETITYNIITQGFGNNMLGYSSAIAVFLFMLIALFSVIQVKLSNKLEV